jgi:hypothetical protein
MFISLRARYQRVGLLFQVSLVFAALVAVTYAQLHHYAPIPVEHHIEEYHHVGTSNFNINGAQFSSEHGWEDISYKFLAV